MGDAKHHNDSTEQVSDKRKPDSTSQKLAGECITDEPQAPAYEPKFRSFSSSNGHGTLDDALKMLMNRANGSLSERLGDAPSQFCIEDPARKTIVTADGEHSTVEPRPSFAEGLRKLVALAPSPEEAERLQGEFSIEYMTRKAQAFLKDATNMFKSLTEPLTRATESTHGTPDAQLIALGDDKSPEALTENPPEKKAKFDSGNSVDANLPYLVDAIRHTRILNMPERAGSGTVEYRMSVYKDGTFSDAFKNKYIGKDSATGSDIFTADPDLYSRNIANAIIFNPVVYIIHTHPDKPGMEPNAFSKEDIVESNMSHADAILIGPDGTLFYHKNDWRGPVDVTKMDDQDREPDRVLGKFDEQGKFHRARYSDTEHYTLEKETI